MGKIVYLADKIDKLFEMYPNSFNKKNKNLLNRLVKMKTRLITKIFPTKCYSLMVSFMKLFF